ncbi:UNVERIFIED_ORG: hypothetical protein BDU10_9669 [Burkholderia sp. CF145]|nr:hypothetical protein PMI06_009941 [Burkholderia sp. BT03]SKC46301.1 hypothetical protein SAMN06266956_0093 [Paraburkholderia hospita]
MPCCARVAAHTDRPWSRHKRQSLSSDDVCVEPFVERVESLYGQSQPVRIFVRAHPAGYRRRGRADCGRTNPAGCRVPWHPHAASSPGIITISVGLAATQAGQDSDPEMLVGAAGLALYLPNGKAGRNCKRVAAVDEQEPTESELLVKRRMQLAAPSLQRTNACEAHAPTPHDLPRSLRCLSLPRCRSKRHQPGGTFVNGSAQSAKPRYLTVL